MTGVPPDTKPNLIATVLKSVVPNLPHLQPRKCKAGQWDINQEFWFVPMKPAATKTLLKLGKVEIRGVKVCQTSAAMEDSV